MATTTGTSSIDWSVVPFDPVNFEADILQFRDRMNQALTEFANGAFDVMQATPTVIVANLFSGGTLNLFGSGFDSNPIITQVRFFHPSGQQLRMNGVIDGVGNETLSSIVIVGPFATVTETVTGSFVLNPDGVFLGGTATQLRVTSNSYTSTITGSLAVNGSGDISGTITGLSIAGADGNISMTGLALPFDATLASITTADQLFSIVGPQLAGNDTITYSSTLGLSLHSGAGNDTITGDGAGIDTLIGGTGNDTYVFTATSGADVVTELADEGIDTARFAFNGPAEVSLANPRFDNVENAVVAGTGAINVTGNALGNHIIGNASANILGGAEGNDTLLGGLANDQLNGDAGNDSLDGGAGNDSMVGGDGDDTYTLNAAGDSVTENAAEGTDTVKIIYSNASTTVPVSIDLGTVYGGGVDNVQLIGTGLFNVTGNAAANTLTGNASNNVLLGGDENDVLVGGAGNDLLNGEIGDDAMSGGTGNDTYDVGSANDEITEAAGAAGGVDLVRSTAATFTLDANLENLTLLGTAVFGTGNTLANLITGNDENNTLNGDAGNDRLLGMAGDDSLAGGLGIDTLTGGDSDDTLDGGAGRDSLVGGPGDDTYVVDGVSAATYDIVTELAGGGSADIVEFGGSGTYVLPGSVENLLLLEIAGTNGTGNALANIITGNSGGNVLSGLGADDSISGGGGNDTLDGGAGNDTMTGGGGDDTFKLDSASDVVVEAGGSAGGLDTAVIGYNNAGVVLTLIAGEGALASVEHVTITGTGLYNVLAQDPGYANMFVGNAFANQLDGGAGNDTLIGLAGNDTLLGGAHNNFLDGGAGVDSMIGGDGNDTYTLDNVGDLVFEGVEGGGDTVRIAYNVSATVPFLIDLNAAYGGHVDNVQVLGTGLFNLTGNIFSNSLAGNASANVIDGGAGDDTMAGGGGNDTYMVNGADTVTETLAGAAGGVDLVMSSVDFALDANVERLTLLAAATSGTGNNLANIITGNDADNILSGDAGNDSLLGLGGNDNLNGGAGKDTLIGGADSDTYVLNVMNGATLATGDLGDVLVEAANQGTDSVHLRGNNTAQTFTFILPTQIEKVFVFGDVGASTVTLTGNALDNELSAVSMPGGSAMLFDGGAGNDTLLGGAGNDNLKGGAGNDSIEGRSGNDALDGGVGNDTMTGGDGNDTYKVDTNPTVAGDVVVEVNDTVGGFDTVVIGYNNPNLVDAITINAGEGFGGVEHVTITGTGLYNVDAGILGIANLFIGNASANVLNGSDGNNTLIGGGGNDTLIGGADDDSLDGGLGSDSMTGGDGNDTYTLNTVADQVVEAAGAGSDTIRIAYNVGTATTINLFLGYAPNVENVQILGTGAFDLIGNEADNTLSGNASGNIFDGLGGDDTMSGGGGNDMYFVDSDGDEVIEALAGAAGGVDVVHSNVDFELGANVENLQLQGIFTALTGTGNALANIIIGNYLDNTLIGDAGNDNLTGMAGNDNLLGGVGNDALNGGDGNDTLDGGTGKDAYVGGLGDDTFVVDGVSAATYDTITDAGGTDTVHFGGTGTYVMPLPMDNLLLLEAAGNANGTGTVFENQMTGNSGNNTLLGLGANDSLTGAGGNDTLDGGVGIDTMTGGDGNDTYKLDTNPTIPGSDVVVETAGTGAGIDTAVVAFNNAGPVITLYAGEAGLPGVENITVTGTGLYNLDGGEPADNILIGNASANVISGGTGNDTLVGGGGNDSLTGGPDAGNDVLDGGTGVDTMVGGSGNDTYTLDSVADLVQEADEGGTDTVKIAYNVAAATTINLGTNYGGFVENLQILGTGLFNLTGNAQNNILTGNASANVLDGGDGADAMSGGGGNDTYFVEHDGDTVTETLAGAAGGVDLVNSSVDFELDDNVERLTLLTGATSGTGNNLANIITGNDQNNILDGGAGKDVLNGGLGNDTYVVDGVSAATYDTIIDTGGDDTVNFGGSGTYVLPGTIEDLLLLESAGNANGTGNALENTLTGNSGNNVLDGGLGNDNLIGGDGDDTYVFNGLGDLLTEILGQGNDTLRLAFNAASPVTVDLNNALYDNVENLQSMGTGDFSLIGDDVANVLTGGATNNTLNGGAGDDTLVGAVGISPNARINLMSGGSGADSFVLGGGWGGTSATLTTIYDFLQADGDKILLDRSFFTALPLGALSPGAFVSGPGAVALDAGDRIIYDTTFRIGYYDPDGTGAAARKEIFNFSNNFEPLVASDFLVIP